MPSISKPIQYEQQPSPDRRPSSALTHACPISPTDFVSGPIGGPRALAPHDPTAPDSIHSIHSILALKPPRGPAPERPPRPDSLFREPNPDRTLSPPPPEVPEYLSNSGIASVEELPMWVRTMGPNDGPVLNFGDVPKGGLGSHPITKDDLPMRR
jgi:hypothetical protein